MIQIKSKRVYDNASEADGLRILVDRLWPRGISKEAARVEFWAKNAAPSDDLRRWFGHDRTRWPEFKRRYFAELDAKAEVVRDLVGKLQGGQATFLFAAKDEEFNNATALIEYLQKRFGES